MAQPHVVTIILNTNRREGMLVAAMDRLWRNPAEAEQMGTRGRQRMVAEFSLDQWLERWAGLIQTLWSALCGSVLTSAISHIAW
ncbi:MAG: hypothetical protein RMK99_14215 [Anaerolineales bacterium]|nr:hypothetical protein [Anaerolineales bacterium]